MISVAPSVPPVIAHQCHIPVPFSAHQCHISVPIRAAFQCRLSMLPNSSNQCRLSVPYMSTSFQCPSVMPVNAHK
ncbi:unnamed protein product [Staurois parvus]|uniref:Uncharacterized protein n=1 Tax=Staurois parvus TaxID=386267 RepID=A0ABN9EY03_9NEOB|nr:unnamed protein product [Staurois parvus]